MIGAKLGSWILERELGKGGMGQVYLARREAPDGPGPEQAAVKVLAAHFVSDTGLLSRFEREIEVLRKLDHPNIVHLLDAGVHEGRPYYVMEYVEGTSYEALLQQRRKLPWAEVLDMALQVCQALKHAHDRGVIHRDLKPSNLLRAAAAADVGIGQFGIVKLTDFGIAWVFAGEHLTVTGAVVGTAEYLSPEQAAGKSPSRRSDLYSLGVVLYTLLTGRTPFEGEPVDLLHKHRYGQFEKPSRLAPDIPHELEEILCELLEKEPAARPADAGVLHKRLDSLRRKYERRSSRKTSAALAGADTDPEHETDGPPGSIGPATLMAHLVREELHNQNRGGPLKRFFNHPVVLVVLFLVTLGLIIWTFLPSSPERLYDRAEALMKSDEPDDWETALDKYLQPLQKRHPEFRKEEVAALVKKAENARESRQEARNARLSGPWSEAHWFYEKGLRLRQQGKPAEAKAVWQELIRAFGEVPAETAWVERARKELTTPSGRERVGEARWASVRKALEHARRLDKEDKHKEAEAIRKALHTLYASDPSARDILKGD